MPIKTMLDASTLHLRKQDRDALQRLAESQKSENWPTPHVYEQGYGWYISAGIMYGDNVADGQERLREEGFSEDFIALMTSAKERDIAMVSFDSDAEPEPGFKLFDFETDEELPSDDDVSAFAR